MRESSIYRGSENIEMDTYKGGKAGIRIAGHLDLTELKTLASALTEGCTMSTIPLAPEWLGGTPSANSLLYEQSKVNHVKMVYKPYVDPLESGAVAFSFENNPDRPSMDVGTPALKKYAEGTYVDTKITESCSLTIRPADMNVRYDADGGGTQSIQGMLRVLSASPLDASLGLGHLYLEYDMDFYSPTLSSPVTEPTESKALLTFGNVTHAVGDVMVFACELAAGGFSTADFVTPPPDGGYVFVCNVTASTGLTPTVAAANLQQNQHLGTVGQEFYARTISYGSTDFTNGSIELVLFSTLETAQQFAADIDGVASDGQLYYGAPYVGGTGTISISTIAVPVV